ncbi:MAG: tetratricopeptide repeat protein [Planctomycetota bacterium]|nr:MAG: tetratricopeptide repeat protein [Planctomycetota bacterium]
MYKCKVRFIVVSAVLVLLSVLPLYSAETWRLGQGQDLQSMSAEGEDKFLLAVAEIKQLVITGQADAVSEALEQLKKEYPEIAGPDFDAFVDAEMLFCKGELSRAMRSYDNFLDKFPESALFEAALDRQFGIGKAFLSGQTRRVLRVFKIRGYTYGKKIMERIIDRVGLGSPIGLRAAMAVAESFESRGKFEDAYIEWQEISTQWPTGQVGKDVLLAMARCKHAAYRGPGYDASNLISAKSYYENFRLRYPEDAKELDVDGKLKLIEEQQARKQLNIGEYYQRTGNKQSANLYYQMVIDNWPGSSAAQIAKAKMEWNLGSEK